MSFFKTTVDGLSWITFLRLSIRVLTFIRIAILARLLLPFEFGLFAIASLSLSFLEIVTETGINSILIQKKEDYTTYLDTAWIISILRGLIISVIILISTPWIASFFSSPSSAKLLYLVSWVAIIRGFVNPASVKFQKELFFKKEFFYRLTLILIEAVFVIIFAFISRSAISLVYSLIISAVAEVFLSHIFIKPRPKLIFHKAKAAEIFNMGKWITGFGILDYIYTTGDNIVVGKILGQSALGIYQNAYKISTFPITELGDVFYKVTFPVYVKMRDFPERLKIAAIKGGLLLSVLLLIASLLIYFLADSLVSIVLGSNWLAAVPVVKTLAFLGFFRGTSNSFNSLFMALNMQKQVSLIILFNALGLAITIVPLVTKYGLVGAGYSAIIGASLSFFPALYLVRKTLSNLSK
jgi:O-antigen/teichoic acid export membrane protein